jgi:hypothetical protein
MQKCSSLGLFLTSEGAAAWVGCRLPPKGRRGQDPCRGRWYLQPLPGVRERLMVWYGDVVSRPLRVDRIARRETQLSPASTGRKLVPIKSGRGLLSQCFCAAHRTMSSNPSTSSILVLRRSQSRVSVTSSQMDEREVWPNCRRVGG